MGVKKARVHEQNGEVRLVDRTTGEIIGEIDKDKHGSLVYVPHRDRYGKDWIVLFQDELMRAAMSDLRGMDLRVYFVLLASTDYENHVRLTQKEIGDLLGTHRQTVNASMRRLSDRGFITLKDNIHYLSLESGWRGRISAYLKAVKKLSREAV